MMVFVWKEMAAREEVGVKGDGSKDRGGGGGCADKDAQGAEAK